MRSTLKLASVVVFIGSLSAQAQMLGTIQDFHVRGWAKAEHGLVVSWQSMPKDGAANQVRVFDKQGHPLTSLEVLHIVPDAATVSISDVSARPGRIIAVAAAYVSKEGNRRVRPASALLIFDFSGHLLSFFSLAPWRDILRLEVDEESNIWALNSNAEEGKDPAHFPMVTEYTLQGAVAKELLPRSLFPSHSDEIRGGSETGYAAIGYNSDGLWFWLPGSTDLVLAPATGGKPVRLNTGLPNQGLVPANLTREDAGTLVAEFRAGRAQRAYYKWSASTNSWTRFKPGGCDGGKLIGTDEEGLVYLRDVPNGTEICLCATP